MYLEHCPLLAELHAVYRVLPLLQHRQAIQKTDLDEPTVPCLRGFDDRVLAVLDPLPG